MNRLLIILLAVLLGGVAVAVGTAAISDSTSSRVIGTFDPAPGEPVIPREKVVVDGGEWSLSTYLNANGQTCAKHRVPGEAMGTLCIDPARMFEHGREVLVLPGARQNPGNTSGQWDNMWIYGFARPNMASLEVVNIDCSVVPIALGIDHTFMHVVSQASIHGGVVPYKVIARNAMGDVAYERDVNIGTPQKDAPNPVPRAECR